MTRAVAAALLACGCHWVPDPAFELGARLRRLPVTVCYMADPDFRDAFDRAVDFWNDQLGVIALVEVSVLDPDADVAVIDAPAYRNKGAASSDPRAGMVFVHHLVDTHQAMLVFAHELGHAAFWLVDDPDHGGSIMAPDVADFDPWAPPRLQRYVTDGDAAAIRATGGAR